MPTHYIAIYEQEFLATGSLEDIVNRVKNIANTIEPIVVESDSCKRVELNWNDSTQKILESMQTANTAPTNKRGRPKLGVKAKEVTLLPRHWEWLSTQRGGASATLRRLVEDARNNASIEDIICMKQQQLDKFILLFLGDKLGFEEASRALYRNSKICFEQATQAWPKDIKTFVMDKFSDIAALHNGQV